jgi:hypothetical protein
VLAVTHNIELAKRFQKICVVAQGTVVEMGGTHKLLALNGHFAQKVRNLSGITVLPSGVAVITAVGRRCTLTPPDPQLKGAWYPGCFNPCTYRVKNWFPNVPFKYTTLHRYTAERLMDMWIFSRVTEARLLSEFTTIFLSKGLRPGEEAATSGSPADSAFIVARGSLVGLDTTFHRLLLAAVRLVQLVSRLVPGLFNVRVLFGVKEYVKSATLNGTGTRSYRSSPPLTLCSQNTIQLMTASMWPM